MSIGIDESIAGDTELTGDESVKLNDDRVTMMMMFTRDKVNTERNVHRQVVEMKTGGEYSRDEAN